MADDGKSDAYGEVIVIPRSESMAEDDYRWHEQVATLYADLRDARVPMRQESTPVPGAKGELEEVILALGSAGVFTAALSAFKAFLNRSRDRSLVVQVETAGQETVSVTLTGDMDVATMERLARPVIRASIKD